MLQLSAVGDALEAKSCKWLTVDRDHAGGIDLDLSSRDRDRSGVAQHSVSLAVDEATLIVEAETAGTYEPLAVGRLHHEEAPSIEKAISALKPLVEALARLFASTACLRSSIWSAEAALLIPLV
jgi:hypothetical protein